jgi:gamma-glutamyltranspeptidase/glutathione hydrolase
MTAPARGMVVTSHPLAVEAGLEMLEAGGSAVDAAVAAAAALTVLDARSTGLGGDVFALCWQPGEGAPEGLAAAGVSPAGMTIEALRHAGHETMPVDGPWSITVPGAPAGWEALLERFGRLERGRVVGPAIRYADGGFPVSRFVAEEWKSAEAKLRANPVAASVFLPGGEVPVAGQRVAFPDLARSLEAFGRDGAAPFYRGDIAERLAAAVQQAGGPLQASDLAEWAGPEWVCSISASYRGTVVHEMPPPGQGMIVLEALRIFEGLRASGAVEEEHALIESLKAAFADAQAIVADPHMEPVPVAEVLDEQHVASRRARISMQAPAEAVVGRPSDTVYVAAVDGEGGACSLIQSVYDGFGSGVAAAGTGIVLQNRASGFLLEAGHPNCPAPRKRPLHTILPAMLERDGRFAGCLGVVGGYMQPQGQAQILRNLIDRGMGPQEALDAPRFRVYKNRRLALEASYPQALGHALEALGHEPELLPRRESGGAQLILVTEDGLVGASDPRKDGHVGRR